MASPRLTPHVTPRQVLIWGGGGHGKVVADLVRATGHDLVGFIDRDATKLGRVVEPGGARVVLAEEAFVRRRAERSAADRDAQAVVLAIGDNGARLAALAHLEDFDVPALVHPSAVVSPSATLGAGTVVFANAVVNAGATVGAAVIVNSGAVVEHDCTVADGAHVSPGAVLSGGVRLGRRSWVGAGATVIPGVHVGADVTVGAGAVVLRDVPDGTTVVGVPARAIATGRRA